MRSLRVFTSLGLASVLAIVVATTAGCGGKGKAVDPKAILAKVDGKAITAGYYETKLAKMEPSDMPRDANGHVIDTATIEGKRKFLDTIINKEVMVNIAKRMGFNAGNDMEYAQKTLLQLESVAAMRARFVDQPAGDVSDQDIQKFYENFGRIRRCHYFISNTRERALAGREKALAGASWDVVFAEFHDGDQSSEVKDTISIPFGRFIPSFENPIYDCAVGEVTEPVPSAYGWWILRIDSEERGKVPALEDARKTIVATLVNRRQLQLKDEFTQRMRAKYKMYVHEDALEVVYNALPKDESLFYPGTKDPVRREDLKPLATSPIDAEMDFYGYEKDGEPRKYTIGDFKTTYDRMSVFERPKRSEMMGGLRDKITGEIDRALLAWEAESRGLNKDPEVVDKVNERLEAMMVQKLFSESVQPNQEVRPAEIDSAWALDAKEYALPELRAGKRLICADPGQAAKAHAALAAGQDWAAVLETYGVDSGDKANGGTFPAVRSDAAGPEREALFGLQVGQYSQPVSTTDGRPAIYLLDSVTPAHEQTKEEAAGAVTQRILSHREEMAFREQLDGWKKQMKIETFEKPLAKTASWNELLAKSVNKPAAPAADAANPKK